VQCPVLVYICYQPNPGDGGEVYIPTVLVTSLLHGNTRGTIHLSTSSLRQQLLPEQQHLASVLSACCCNLNSSHSLDPCMSNFVQCSSTQHPYASDWQVASLAA
jgi:hypothetical protein